MKNIKSTIIGAFCIVIAISLISSAISFVGYRKVIDSVNDIEANKLNQDSVQILNRLSAERQQVLTDIVSSYNDDSKSFADIGNKIDSELKALGKAKISSADKKTVEELDNANKKYISLFNDKINPNIKAFENKDIRDFLKGVQDSFNEMQSLVNELQKTTAGPIEDRSARLMDDITELNRIIRLVDSDSSYIDNQFTEIKKLLADIEIYLDTAGSDVSTVQDNDYNAKLEDLEQRISAAAAGTQTILDNARSTQGFDRVWNMKKVAGDLQLYNVLLDIAVLTNRNNAVLLYSATEGKDMSSEFTKNKKDIDIKLADLLKKGLDSEKIDRLAALNKSIDVTAQEIYKRVTVLEKGWIADGYKSMTQLNKAFLDNTEKLRVSFNNYFSDDIKSSEKIKGAILGILILITLFSIIIGMLLALFLSNKIAKPIHYLSNILSKVEKGDLTVRAEIAASNDIGELGKQVNNVLDGQQKIVEQFKDTGSEISSLKQRVRCLVDQNRETMEKISVTKSADREGFVLDTESIISGVKTVTEQAQKAVGDSVRAVETAKLKEKTVEEAEMFISSVNETVRSIAASIGNLESSSGRIGEITNTITQIASQTNLLALNAAIEANRAGQQGKGFAVVADEIRKLSNLSNKSAAEIKEQIKDIQSSINTAVEKMNSGLLGVEDGAARINELKKGITEIIQSISSVTDTVKASADKAYSHYQTAREFVEVVDKMASSASDNCFPDYRNVDSIIQIQAKTVSDLDEISMLLNDASADLFKISESVKV
ncbi:HAMP domain-containing methyl-accepting chemotaxis protein [Ruminiclostridium cellulolyticum]|uniref:Methyl-accepting chemotaxis sensory transducer n=1 Tax=Ruminiclostridium cellulolyticum (strain ATCC 35319 / DSM 5812 / JCM 6584 / H10) TaxID=394503 RepID=B8I868_RUMCH|nr:methyl-accepting chemotaxis protein [Ruminiclostridium cellulolyticum]ACL77168.1 methyl-accepting chemotaxis sensory transducer [Ruminiclostridium cellulolyticum H10]